MSHPQKSKRGQSHPKRRISLSARCSICAKMVYRVTLTTHGPWVKLCPVCQGKTEGVFCG